MRTSKIFSVNKGFAPLLIIATVAAATITLAIIILLKNFSNTSPLHGNLVRTNTPNPESNTFNFKNSAAYIVKEYIKNPTTGIIDNTKYKLFFVDIDTGMIKEVPNIDIDIDKIEFSPDKSLLALDSPSYGKDIFTVKEGELKPTKLAIKIYTPNDIYFGTNIRFVSWSKDNSSLLYTSYINSDYYHCPIDENRQGLCDEEKKIKTKYSRTKTDLKIQEGLFSYNIESKKSEYVGKDVPRPLHLENMLINTNGKVVSFTETNSVLEGVGHITLKNIKTNNEIILIENVFLRNKFYLSEDEKMLIFNYDQRGPSGEGRDFAVTNYGLVTIDLNTLDKKYLTKGQIVDNFVY